MYYLSHKSRKKFKFKFEYPFRLTKRPLKSTQILVSLEDNVLYSLLLYCNYINITNKSPNIIQVFNAMDYNYLFYTVPRTL